MATFLPIIRYPDGREVPGQAFSTDEHFGIGQTVEHDGRRWRAVDSRQIGDDPNRFAVIFDPDE